MAYALVIEEGLLLCMENLCEGKSLLYQCKYMCINYISELRKSLLSLHTKAQSRAGGLVLFLVSLLCTVSSPEPWIVDSTFTLTQTVGNDGLKKKTYFGYLILQLSLRKITLNIVPETLTKYIYVEALPFPAQGNR